MPPIREANRRHRFLRHRHAVNVHSYALAIESTLRWPWSAIGDFLVSTCFLNHLCSRQGFGAAFKFWLSKCTFIGHQRGRKPPYVLRLFLSSPFPEVSFRPPEGKLASPILKSPTKF